MLIGLYPYDGEYAIGTLVETDEGRRGQWGFGFYRPTAPLGDPIFRCNIDKAREFFAQGMQISPIISNVIWDLEYPEPEFADFRVEWEPVHCGNVAILYRNTPTATLIAGTRLAELDHGEFQTRVDTEIRRHPRALFDLSPERFEGFVGDLLRDMGCTVHMTSRGGGDGGRDILATYRSPFGELLCIVECKRYRRDRPVELPFVRGFLHSLRDVDKASCGMIVTTSYFSSGVLKHARDYPYQLQLVDFERLREWLSVYGTWRETESGHLLVPAANQWLEYKPQR